MTGSTWQQQFIDSQIAFSRITAEMIEDDRGKGSEGYLLAVVLRTLATDPVAHRLFYVSQAIDIHPCCSWEQFNI